MITKIKEKLKNGKLAHVSKFRIFIGCFKRMNEVNRRRGKNGEEGELGFSIVLDVV